MAPRRTLFALVAIALTAVAAAPTAAAKPAPASGENSNSATRRIVVGYDADSSPAEAAPLERRLGARLVRTIGALDVRVLDVPRDRLAQTLAALERDPSVRFAERDGIVSISEVRPNDEHWPSEWSPVKTNAPRAWDLGTGSPQVAIAVVDTGVDGAHPDLQGKLAAGYDIFNGDADASDDHGHGTSVAGVIGAASNNTIGVASYCWRCSIMPVKVLGADGKGTDSQVASGIVWAVDHGAKVVNLSLGGPAESSALAGAVQYARERGVLVVGAAGNQGTTAPTYPAAYRGVLSVAASDEGDRLFSWSNSGSWVALAAPGTNATTARGGGYTGFSGTSSAAPVVAGIAGLAFSAAPGATAAQVEQALRASAVPVQGVAQGRVDAFRTLAALVPASATAQPQPQSAPAPRQATSRTKRTAKQKTRAGSSRRVVAGALAARARARTFRLAVGGGKVVVNVAAKRSAPLKLTIRRGDGKVVALAKGTRGVRLVTRLRAGTYRYVVSGETKRSLAFTLAVTFRAPPRRG